MKKTILALTGVGLLAGTAALAQPGGETTGPMTRADVTQKSADMFQKMDLNSDGVLDLSDQELRRQQRIAKIDTDGNNAISKAEREAAREARQAKRAEWREERGIEGERRGFGKRKMRRGGMRDHHGRGMGGGGMAMRADADGDGRVSLQEFQTQALARFDKADANSDGTVTAEERKAAREAHRAAKRERFEQRRAARAAQ